MVLVFHAISLTDTLNTCIYLTCTCIRQKFRLRSQGFSPIWLRERFEMRKWNCFGILSQFFSFHPSNHYLVVRHVEVCKVLNKWDGMKRIVCIWLSGGSRVVVSTIMTFRLVWNAIILFTIQAVVRFCRNAMLYGIFIRIRIIKQPIR